jgi:hypothetical protein
VLPYGISSGFVSITLPFVLVRAGFSVALAASIVAIGVSSNLWRFLWGPVADLTLTARRWYLLGLGIPGSSSMDQSAKAIARVKRYSLIKQFSTAFLQRA